MSRLPSCTASELIRKLRHAGFVFDRHAKGSHEIWMHPVTRRRTVVPNHPGNMAKGTLRAILKQAGVSVNKFIEL